MGWLFYKDPNFKREDLVKQNRCELSNGQTLIDEEVVGNNHWMLIKDSYGQKFIAVGIMMHGGDNVGWGSKLQTEHCNPPAVNCPIRLLNQADPTFDAFAQFWRSRVESFHRVVK